MTRLKAIALLVLVAVPALFLGLGRRELWNPVEPRYAGVTAEVLNDGRWLVPSYNGRDYDQKPAFFFWLTAAAVRGGEGHEDRLFRLRLPSALGGFLLALATLLIGRRLFDTETGLLAGAMILSCWLTFWSGRFCHLDTLSAASLGFLIHAMLARAGGGSRWFLVEATLALAAGLLLKGPGVILFAFLAFLLAGLLPTGRGCLRRSGLLVAAPLGIGIAACWFLPAWMRAGDVWARGLLVDAGVFHIVDPNNAAKHGPLYYAGSLWTVAAPWSFLLPAALLGRFRDWRRGDADERERRGNALLLAWILAILLVLHLGTTYRSRYLLPLLPPIMLLIARSLRRELAGGGLAGGLARLGLGLGLTLLLLLGGSLVLPEALAARLDGDLPALVLAALSAAGPVVPALGLAILGLSLGGAILMLRVRTNLMGVAATMVAALVLVFAAWGLEAAPAVDRLRGDAELFATIAGELPGRQLTTVENYGLQESTAGFYGFELGVKLGIVPTGRASLDLLRSGPPVLLLLRERDLVDLELHALAGWKRVGDRALGRHEVWLFRNEATEAGR